MKFTALQSFIVKLGNSETIVKAGTDLEIIEQTANQLVLRTLDERRLEFIKNKSEFMKETEPSEQNESKWFSPSEILSGDSGD